MGRSIVVIAAVLLSVPLLGATALAAPDTPARAQAATSASTKTTAAPVGSASAGKASTGKLPTKLATPPGKLPPADKGSAIPPIAIHPTENTCGALPKIGYATCFAVKRTDVPAHKGLFAASTAPAGYGPSDLQSAYNLPSSSAAGEGETVAIVDAYDDPSAEADLQVYRAQYGLPVCDTANGCFTKVAQDGTGNYPPASTDWATEISLDLDMVSAICPNCHILLVEANDNSMENLGAAVNEAVALGAKYVSNSYGGTEDPSELSEDASYYDHPGVVITASSGDSGYGVEYPAASQYVTAVGGTSLVQDADTTRGWAETAWSGAGSGCSAYEPKPSWQTDTGCSNRTVADVSAVADPNTGVAVYDTTGASGWGVWGGTSVASPIIASVYALAGTPVAGTYPSSYPYADPSALNDVTSGSTDTCSPSYLCTAGPGYDGPTGLGTPDGVAAFTSGPQGTLSGTVTDASTGAPVQGARVTIGDYGTTTGSNGAYSLSVPAGTYTVTAADFGYATQTDSDVTISSGESTTETFSLQSVPSVTVAGRVTDGSGQGWPLYAKVSIVGTPASTYTNPATGDYSLTLPVNTTYNLTVDAAYPGYHEVTQSVTVGTSGMTQNVSVPIDETSCSAPGYQFDYNGTMQTFDGTTAPAGWTVVNSSSSTGGWQFSDPPGLSNMTGGSGGFALAYSDNYGDDLDTELVSPVVDMSQDTSPYIQFDSDLFGWFGDVEDVDVSINGGQTWANVWQSTGYPGTGVTGTAIPLPMAAGQPDVQVRFHYVSNDGQYWELDNVFIGNRSCDTIPGGMLEGTVTDGNTGGGVNGAAVTSASDPAVTATTAPADPSIGDGFYYLFAPGSGSQSFTAAMAKYASTTKNVTVAQGSVTTADLVLQAGQLSITPASVSETVALGSSKSSSLTFKNTGKAPADVKLYGDPGSFSLSGEPAATDGKGAPLQRVKGAFSPMSMPEMKKKDPSALKALSQPASEPADGPWTTVPDYPLAVVDNAAATDPATGLVYSVGGITSSLVVSAAAYVYNPSAQAWTALPPMQVAREAPSVAFINGELYVTGGWGSDGNPVNSTEIYDPAKQTWSAGASEPIAVAGAGTTVLGDEMYVIGGCDTSSCTQAGSTQVYDPISDSWSAGGAYPTGIAWEGCGAISGDIFCAGGTTSSTTDTADAYEYDPGTQTWSSIAPIPIDMWAMGYAASNGELLLSGGVTDGTNTVTNQGFAYDVADGSWTALPNSDNTDYRGGSACGMYRIAGTTSGFEPESDVEELPGYGSCQTTDVPWMSETADTFTVQPGASQTVTVTLNAGDPSVAQPGTYTASLLVSDDSPYLSNPVGVSMNVTAPSTWGKIMGTVTGDSCGGTPEPLQGATVQIDGPADYTLKTDQSGDYALWLAQGTLTVIVAKNGWTPTAAVVKITKGQVTTADYTLKPASC